MGTMKKWLYLIAGGIGALAIAAAVLFVYAGAADAAGTMTQPAAIRAAAALPLAREGIEVGLHGGGPIPMSGYDEALAAALDITVEELQAAYDTARTAAIQQAVEEGLLTQEQADDLLSNEGGVGHHGMFGFRGGSIDFNALLADALGISVEELEAAQQEAKSAVIAQAVEDGAITQEQADLMLAQDAVRPYVAAAMSAAYEEAIQQAVADGVITQEQADALLASPWPGM